MAAVETHPLITAFRQRVANEDELTQAQIAEQVGVSLRTVQNWLLTDTTPQKRHRPKLRQWLNGEAAA